MNNGKRRKQNESKFGAWDDLPDGGRRYFYEVQGHHGWSARYVKVVDDSEQTIKFFQEIFDEDSQLVEIHEKYPANRGHVRVKGGVR